MAINSYVNRKIGFVDKKLILREFYGICVLFMVPILLWNWVANPEGSVSNYYVRCNLALIYVLELSVFTIFRNLCFSTCITSILISVLYIANDIVTQLRGTPFTARDMFSFRTALSVSQDYLPNLVIEGDISNRFFYMIAIIMLVALSSLFLRKQIKCNGKHIKIVERAISFSACLFLVFFISKIDTGQWDMSTFWHQSETSTYGNVLCFYKECKELKVEKPEGYNKKQVETVLSGYIADAECENKPDIIVIMNEAWTDFSIFSGYSDLNIDSLPYIHEAVRSGQLDFGYLHTSVWGGRYG